MEVMHVAGVRPGVGEIIKRLARLTTVVVALGAVLGPAGPVFAQGVTTGRWAASSPTRSSSPSPARASSRSTSRRGPPTKARRARTAGSRFSACALAVPTRSPFRRQRRAPASSRRRRRRSRSTWASRRTSTSACSPIADEVTVTGGIRSGLQLEPHRRGHRGQPRDALDPADDLRPARDVTRLTPQAGGGSSFAGPGQPPEQHHGRRLVLQQLVRPRRHAGRSHGRGADFARGDRAGAGQHRALRRAPGQLRRRAASTPSRAAAPTSSAAPSTTSSATRTWSAPRPGAAVQSGHVQLPQHRRLGVRPDRQEQAVLLRELRERVADAAGHDLHGRTRAARRSAAT